MAAAATPIVVRTRRETISDRLKDIRGQVDALAREHVAELVAAIKTVERLSGEIAGLPGAFPPGVVDLARRLGEDVSPKALTLSALMDRA